MASYNKVILLGNLTRDPELRYLPKGTAVARVGMALNRTYKNDAGEKVEDVTFVDVDAFGRTAEVISQYCKKGSALMVEGRLKLDTWQDKQTGKNRQKLGIIAETCQFIGGQKGGQNQPEQAAPKREQPAQSDLPPGETNAPEEDDVPF